MPSSPGCCVPKCSPPLDGPTYRFIEAKFGEYPADVVRGGDTQRAGVRSHGLPLRSKLAASRRNRPMASLL